MRPSMFNGDTLLTFKDAAKWINPEQPPHVSTLYRWQLNGVRGVKLTVTKVGGRSFIRLSNLERFINELNRGAIVQMPMSERARKASEELQRRGC